MKKSIVALLLCAALQTAFADGVVVGTSRYLDQNTGIFVDLFVAINADGTVDIETHAYDYHLTPAERNVVAGLLKEGVRLLDVAATNKTTIDYGKKIGESALSTTNGLLTVEFQSKGWEDSYVVISTYNGGQNLVMMLDRRQANDLLTNMSRAVPMAGDIAKQRQLFQ